MLAATPPPENRNARRQEPDRHHVRRAQPESGGLRWPSGHRNTASGPDRGRRHAVYRRLYAVADLRTGACQLHHRAARARASGVGQRHRLWRHAAGLVAYAARSRPHRGFHRQAALQGPRRGRLRLHREPAGDEHHRRHRRRHASDPRSRRRARGGGGQAAGAGEAGGKRLHAVRPADRRRRSGLAAGDGDETTRQAVGVVRVHDFPAFSADGAARTFLQISGAGFASAEAVRPR